ncbi:MAG: hypothetical protein WDZ35_08985 [Crocinitomicaceae bacterium]
MKKTIIFFLALLAFSATAQIKVSEKSVDIDGSKNGFYVEIPYADQKSTEKELKSLLKDWKGSFSSKKDVLFADDCSLKSMGENTFDAYGKVEENGDEGVYVSVAIDLGGAYLNSGEHKDQYKVMEKILKEWAIEVAKEVIGEQIKEEEKVLSDKEKELEDLKKEQEKMEKEIEDYKKAIEKNEKAIEDSKKAQEEQKEKIKTQQGVVEAAKKKQQGIK